MESGRGRVALPSIGPVGIVPKFFFKLNVKSIVYFSKTEDTLPVSVVVGIL